MDSKFRSQLTKALCSIEAIGDFSTGGIANEIPCSPGLWIKGIEEHIPFPINTATANSIKSVGKIAPFGKGFQTVVDESVRKAWELDAEFIKFENPKWNTAVECLAQRVAGELGCGDCVTPILYKALLYETGGHFKAHKDTEKEDSMFATLIIQLPCKCTGGTLVTRHGNKEKHYDFGEASGEALFNPHYAAHYADVEHELLKVTSGYRFVLAYSLCWNGSSPSPSLETFEDTTQKIASVLANKNNDKNTTSSSWPVGIVLEHEYTERSMLQNSQKLKGRDDLVFSALTKSNEKLEPEKRIKIYIVRLSREVSSYKCVDDYDDYSDFDDDYDDDDGWEVAESENKVEDWLNPDGTSHPEMVSFDFQNLIDLNIEQVDVNDNKWWGKIYKRDIEGYTGNAGPNKDTVYKRYALLFYPEASEFDLVLQSKGLYLAAYSLQKSFSTTSATSFEEKEKRLGKYKKIHSAWTANCREKIATILLDIVVKLEDLNTAKIFLLKLASMSQTDKLQSFVGLVQKYSWEALSETLQPILIDSASFTPLVELIREKLVSTCDPVVHLMKTKCTAIANELSSTIQLKSLWDLLSLTGELEKLKEFSSHLGNIKADSVTLLLLELARTASGNDYAFKILLEKKTNSNSLIFKSVDHALLIWRFLSEKGDIDEQKAFAKQITQRMSPRLLSDLISQLSSFHAFQKVPNDSPIGALLLHRIEYLNDKAHPPEFTWAMPNAMISDHPTVTAFLRDSTRTTFTYSAFTGIPHCRNWINKHFRDSGFYSSHQNLHQLNYSAKVNVGGRGSSSYVVLTKTKLYYERIAKQCSKYKREQNMLKSKLVKRPRTSTPSEAAEVSVREVIEIDD